MKYKDPIESCGGVTKEHGYLGHFSKSKHLSRGHNSEPIKETDVPNRTILEVDRLDEKTESRIPNIFKGELQPDSSTGNSLPETYDPKKPVRI